MDSASKIKKKLKGINEELDNDTKCFPDDSASNRELEKTTKRMFSNHDKAIELGKQLYVDKKIEDEQKVLLEGVEYGNFVKYKYIFNFKKSIR